MSPPLDASASIEALANTTALAPLDDSALTNSHVSLAALTEAPLDASTRRSTHSPDTRRLPPELASRSTRSEVKPSMNNDPPDEAVANSSGPKLPETLYRGLQLAYGHVLLCKDHPELLCHRFRP